MTATNTSIEGLETLCQIFVIFRHGQRAPMIFAPADPNKKHWPHGPGSLTNIGKEDGYLVGKLLRQRYADFLSETYDKDEIYVRSTDVERTMMTAQCCLAGLFPPKGNDVWMDKMPWQPIPVHAMPSNSDPLTVILPKKCVPPPEGYPKEEQTSAYKIICDNEHSIKAISANTSAEGHIGFTALLFETFALESYEHLPAYLPPGLELSIKEARFLAHTMYHLMTQTSKCIVSGSVYLLNDILAKAQKKTAEELPKQKAFLYSLHDLNISVCLSAFNKTARPDYGGSLIFELHKCPETKKYFIKVIYKNSIRDLNELEEIDLNGKTTIPFSDFEEMIHKFAISSNKWTD